MPQVLPGGRKPLNLSEFRFQAPPSPNLFLSSFVSSSCFHAFLPIHLFSPISFIYYFLLFPSPTISLSLFSIISAFSYPSFPIHFSLFYPHLHPFPPPLHHVPEQPVLDLLIIHIPTSAGVNESASERINERSGARV